MINKAAIINIAIFQVGWFVCVLGGNSAAIIFTFAALLGHQLIFSPCHHEWRLIIAFSVIGCLWDTLLIHLGIIQLNDSVMPIWLFCLWILFSTTLNRSLSFLHHRKIQACFLALLLAPLTYISGAHLAGIQLATPFVNTVFIIAIGWSVLFPIGILVASKIPTTIQIPQEA